MYTCQSNFLVSLVALQGALDPKECWGPFACEPFWFLACSPLLYATFLLCQSSDPTKVGFQDAPPLTRFAQNGTSSCVFKRRRNPKEVCQWPGQVQILWELLPPPNGFKELLDSSGRIRTHRGIRKRPGWMEVLNSKLGWVCLGWLGSHTVQVWEQGTSRSRRKGHTEECCSFNPFCGLEEIPPQWRRLKVLFYSNLFGMAVRNWICVHRKSLESLELNLICNYETFGKLHAWCINLTTHRDRL